MLSASINDSPHLVSIRASGNSRGRSRYRFEAPPERLVQVHLAGFAAEELFVGRPPRQLFGELGISIAVETTPAGASLAEFVTGSDQHLAVKALLELGCARTDEALRAGVHRYYLAAKASLTSVWPAVRAAAEALLKHSELDGAAFRRTIGMFDIYGPVSAVQRAHDIRGTSTPAV